MPNRNDVNWKGGKPELANIFGESFHISFLDDVIVSKTEDHNWSCNGCGAKFTDSIQKIQTRDYGCSCAGPCLREDYSRFILTELTGCSFKKVRSFDWLKNGDGNPLEIDCYSEELNIGCEDNGSIHERLNRLISEKQRKRQKDHQKIKRKLCPNKFELFFEIPPEVPKRRKLLEDFIKSELIKYGFGDKILNERVDWNKFSGKMTNKKKLAELINEFKKKFPNVECLHENYDDRHELLPWVCGEENHPITKVSFSQAQGALRDGRRLPCTYCSNKVRITIEEMHEHAKKMSEITGNSGGTCKTEELTKAGKTIVVFDCGVEGHDPYKCTASNVRNSPDKRWCRLCKPTDRRKITTRFVRNLCDQYNHTLHGEYRKNTEKMLVNCNDCGFPSHYNFREMENKMDSDWCDACKLRNSREC